MLVSRERVKKETNRCDFTEKTATYRSWLTLYGKNFPTPSRLLQFFFGLYINIDKAGRQIFAKTF